MPTITGTSGPDEIIQGFDPNRTGLTIFSLGGDDIIRLDRDDDLGGFNVVSTAGGNDQVLNAIEQGSAIRLGAGSDTYVGLGFGSFATDRGDVVRAGGGADTLAFSTFKSTYLGQGGSDTFFSVGWQNTINGGKGRDLLSYEGRDDDETQGGTSVVVDLAQGLVQTGANRFETVLNIEDIIGTGFDDTIGGSAKGNSLTGGDGFDALIGRGGADTFVYRDASEAPVVNFAVEQIQDFTAAQNDRIDLRQIDAVAGGATNEAFSFRGSAAFTGVAGQLRTDLDEIPGALTLSGDVDGDGVADFRIALVGVGSLDAGSLFL